MSLGSSRVDPAASTAAPHSGRSGSMASVVFVACCWTAVLLIINRALFHVKLIETGDLATILFQVRDAEHFRELLGNYSRWGFHHPGPGYMYVLALGDLVFRRLLHLCPEPANAAFLTMLLLNVALLFATIALFARYCRSQLFLPAAALMSLWLIYLINRTNGPVATTDVWLPHMLLFVFLLFLSLCAAVATGSARALPVALLCGGLLVHGHVAQAMFVAILMLCALVGLYLSSVRHMGVAGFATKHRNVLLVSAGLVLLFAAPIVLDRVLDHPNNIHQIRAYMAEHRGERTSWADAGKYELSFITFTASPETRIPESTISQLVSEAVAQPHVLLYWIGCAVLLGLLEVALRRKTGVVPAFLRCAVFQALLVAILFLYWARRITGPLYGFNGFFFYAVQFVIAFVCLAIVLEAFAFDASRGVSFGLACAMPLLMFTSPATFQRVGTNRAAHPSPELQQFALEVEKIANAVPRQQATIRIRFPNDGLNWALAMGVASRLHWADQPLCVDEDAAGWVEARDVCRRVDGLENLNLIPAGAAAGKCETPCRVLMQDDAWAATLAPFPAGRLPFAIGPDAANSLNLNFYPPSQRPMGPQWTKMQSTMRFLLRPDWTTITTARVKIDGRMQPGYTVHVLLNGHDLGAISGDGTVAQEFVASRELFNAGSENELTFHSDGAVGIELTRVEFEPAP